MFLYDGQTNIAHYRCATNPTVERSVLMHRKKLVAKTLEINRIDRSLPVLRDVIAGKTLQSIEQERGRSAREHGVVVQMVIRMLHWYCDPQFELKAPGEGQLGDGARGARLIHEHGTLYLRLIDRYENLVAFSKKLSTLDEPQLRVVEITTEPMFPMHYRSLFIAKDLCSLGDLLDLTAGQLIDAGFSKEDVSWISELLPCFGLELPLVQQSWLADERIGGQSIEVLELHTIIAKRLDRIGVRTIRDLARLDYTDMTVLSAIGSGAVRESKKALAAYVELKHSS